MGSIAFPAVMVAAIGLVAGVILTIAAKLMFVPVDERVAAVREVLPGANCGACGYAGCDDYANALGDDPDLSVSLCPVGGATCAQQIAGIMGAVAEEMDPQKATILCKGNTEVTKMIMEDDRLHTCKEAKMFYGGPWACPHGCLGLGDCAKVCQYDAIVTKDGLAEVNRDKCVGCGACVKACPNGIIAMLSEKDRVFVTCKSIAKGAVTRKACSTGCIGCMKCQKACKFEAIVVENNVAKVDYKKCKNCGLCAKECPTGAITVIPKKAKPKMTPEQIAAAKEAAAKKKAEAEAAKAEETVTE